MATRFIWMLFLINQDVINTNKCAVNSHSDNRWKSLYIAFKALLLMLFINQLVMSLDKLVEMICRTRRGEHWIEQT